MNEFTERAEKLKKESGGYWGLYDKEYFNDWQYEVANEDTREGYWMWLAARLVSEEEEAEDTQLQDQVDTFNKYSSDIMRLDEVAEEYFHMHIGGTLVTRDDYINMLDRVKQINRENGFSYLEESE